MMKRNYQANLEFIQWMKELHDRRVREGIDPDEEKKTKEASTAPEKPRPLRKNPTGRSSQFTTKTGTVFAQLDTDNDMYDMGLPGLASNLTSSKTDEKSELKMVRGRPSRGRLA